MRTLFLIFLLVFIITVNIYSQNRCIDYILLDGTEPLHSYGMDTTNNWWAFTQPFSDKYRLIVNGDETDVYEDMTVPVFSPDGKRWAAFGIRVGRIELITEDGATQLVADDFGRIFFNSNSSVLAYSYFQSGMEIINTGDMIYEVINRAGDFFVDENGYQIAFTGRRADGVVVNINGEESTVFDDVTPIGFWHDANFMYAAKIGNGWQIYKGNRAITEVYTGIYEPVINLSADVLGFAVSFNDGNMAAVLISDEYREPLIGKRYSSVSNIVLHPTLPLIAYNAIYNTQNIVVLNTTDYSARLETGVPYFTHDGYDLYFLTCDGDCYLNISGQQIFIQTNLHINTKIAMAPQTETYAYSTSSTMMVHSLKEKKRYAGMMVDRIIAPRYNWRKGEYQALGDINNRLYMLTCRF